MEFMSLDESSWEYSHHRSSFLPNANSVGSDFVSLINFDIVEYPQTPVLLQGVDSEGNLCNITKIIPLDISVKPGVVEHIHIGQNYSTTKIEEYRSLLRTFVMFFPGFMKKCPGLIHLLSYMRSRHTQR